VARSVEDTDDLVQEVLLQTVRRLARFDYRREHALQAYLRRAIDNRIRNQLRHSHRRPERDELTDDVASRGASTLEDLVGRETMSRYEAALSRLRPADREAIVAKIELDCSLEELAKALGRPSPEAARKAITRAILRLAREMASDG
jgi:RNA polymerase sigma-70 factor (ECF subfamily)